MTVFELEALLKLDSDEYEKGLDSAEGKATGFGTAVSTGLKIGLAAIAAAGAAIVGIGTSSVKAGMEFDSAMSQVAATMGQTTESEDIQRLREFAQVMGSSTAFSATEAAQALNYMALAGYDADKSMSMLPSVLSLAAAGGIDLAYASDMVTDASSALGLGVEDTYTLIDQMAMASSKSNTSVGQLGEAILTLGATGRSIRGGTNELTTILGVLADNGIKGAEGGTHLRNMLLSLQNPTEDAAALMDEYNIKVYDTDGSMRSLVDIVGDLQTATEGMDDASRDAIVSGIFNKTDLASVNALLGTSKDRFNELSLAIGDSAGAAQAMADTQLDNLAGDITLFKSALEGAKIAISDEVTPTLREFVEFGTTAISDFTKAFKEDGLEGAMSVIGEKLVELGGMITDTLPSVLSASLSLIDAVVSGISDNADSLGDTLGDIIVLIIEGASDMLPKMLTAAVDIATSLVTSLSENLDTIIPAFTDGVVTLIDTIPDVLPNLIDAATTLVLALVDELPTLFTNIADAIPDLIAGLMDALPQMLVSIQTIISAIGENLPTLIQSLVSNGILGLTQLVTGIIVNLPTILETALLTVGTAIDAIISGVFSGISLAAAQTFQDVDWLNAYDTLQSATTLKKAIDDLTTSMETLSQQHIENLFDVEINTDVYQNYIDRFNELVDNQGVIKSGYEEEVKQILSILGVDAEVRDGQVQDIGSVKSEIDTLIETYNREAYTQVELANKTEWLTKRRQAVNEYSEAVKTAQESIQNAMQLDPEASNYDEAFAMYMDAASIAVAAAFEAANSISEADAQIDLSNTNMDAIAAGAWDNIKDTLEAAGIDVPDVLNNSIGDSMEEFLTFLESSLDGSGAVFGDFQDALETTLESMGFSIDWTTGQIVQSLDTVVDEMSETGEELPNTLATGIQAGVDTVDDAVGEVVETITGKFSKEELDLTKVGTVLTTDLHGGMLSGQGDVETAAGELADSITGEFENTPTEMKEKGSDSGDKLQSGLRTQFTIVQNALKSLAGFFNSEMSGISNIMYNHGDVAGSRLADAITNKIPSISNTSKNMFSVIVSPFANIGSTMYTYGSYAGQGMYNGLSGWGSTLSTMAYNIASNINTAAKSALKISSPSAVLRDTFNWAGEGIYLGLADKEMAIFGEADYIVEGLNSRLNEGIAATGIESLNSATSTINTRTSQAENKQDRLYNLLLSWLPQLANTDIYLDGDELVGHTYSRMEQKLGDAQAQIKRGGMAYA